MDESKLIGILLESGIPEDKVQEMADAFKQNENVFKTLDGDRDYGDRVDTHQYLLNLSEDVTDWRKRAQLAAAIISNNLD